MITENAARGRLIVALDFPSVAEARQMVAAIGDAACFYKVGLELVMRGGLELVHELKSGGRKVFLDMKFLDIGNQVENAVAGVAEIGVDLVTTHGVDTKTVSAAARGRGRSNTRVLAVTVMTNLGTEDLREQRINAEPAELVLERAKLSIAAGADGVVASGQEAGPVRTAIGPGKLIVTPGIRLPSDSADDQVRVATPASAIAAGADYLVVGRPITRAPDPNAAAQQFVAEIAKALSAST